ncbi:hypothetical protein MSG28_009804 [Choristoneura fumiferana]|uniref:Uncharacterized protein n=1 Tax=Choristoneura fumiferana TaxID=7141 RepID=A0ACC0JCQ3_CHOFU|nr:hypothetical protein MSG28_009804 [Choristoneura fumiferana]
MTPKCYMGTIDLKDAYFLLGIHPKYKKYLRFMWNNQPFQERLILVAAVLSGKRYHKEECRQLPPT